MKSAGVCVSYSVSVTSAHTHIHWYCTYHSLLVTLSVHVSDEWVSACHLIHITCIQLCTHVCTVFFKNF